MAISLELWASSCLAPKHPPPQSFLVFPFLESSFRYTSCRFASVPLRGRASSRHRAGVAMDAEAVRQRPSEGALHNQESSIMAQYKIPCLFMRGGTSRGPYFLRQHLPKEKEMIDKVLLRVMGSPDHKQISGLGGATSVTSKVAIISVSKEPGIDVDYTFAQVSVHKSFVDWEPSCGNMLAGVGPAAIEMGLIPKIGHPVTPIKIRATNNGALVEALVQTPNHEVTYDGDASIAGVPGTAAPVMLNFMNVVGSKSKGKLLPTDQVRDKINGVEVTCIDVAMPIVIAKASSLGKTGYESKVELDKDTAFFEKIEAIRLIAGQKMGFGDVTGRVIPKFAIVAEPRNGGQLTARYFVPDSTHTAMAVTGAICIGCCSKLLGSVAYDVSTKGPEDDVVIEHPSGKISINVKSEHANKLGAMLVHKAGVLRTCRLLFEGSVQVSKAGLESVEEFQANSGLQKYRDYHQQLQKDFRNLYKFQSPENGVEAVWDGSTEDAIKPSVVNSTAVTA